ncbi:sugar ABC transporter substrate-binding protein [Priestia megaterium]|uniref:sugar ABC transporter substrate-binding protein n=1 Tax=Bacillaceae TaxID=186817 RepID=UPI001482F6D8|nr:MULTISPECIES: sugar ABC transporter substrate-binding protein [Bacillaceae]MEC1903573.1 sugar ABC transporter substrate-binding protein [Bacillus atrophaeus]MEC2399444.1 sugar ABC transporter substrate-binding protein [Bacillus atrophaeus]MED4437560.1 sugar ABC transporter substrate-binding protein [Bacillus atrophaeus]MED4567595.1 sugar ABC transporter substrate-binding protein [Bacillus atrophaeus]MED4778505.1 sugar ABC transporter substrate-binding protein [Bacillus atrophaeus]
MFKNKLSFFLLIIFILSLFLIVYIPKKLSAEKPNVTVVLKELNPEYWRIMEAGARKGFQDFGVNGKVIAPSDGASVEEQDRFLERVLMESPDSLIIAPIYTDYISSALEDFVEQDIPVILLDTDIAWEDKTAYVGTDNVTLGRRAGELLGSQLQPGNEVAILGVDTTNSSAISDRIKGAKISLQSVGIEIVAEGIDISSEPLQVKEDLKMVLDEHPNLKGIIATTDELALPVFHAIEDLGYKIPVIGTDGSNEMIKLIEEEKLPGTVAQNSYDMGYLSVEAAMKVLNGENVSKNIDSGVDIIIKENAKQRFEFQERVQR